MGNSGDFILYGPREEKQEETESLGEKYLASLQEHRDKIALIDEIEGNDITVTYAEVLLQAKAVAGLLREQGLGSGDTVMLCCGNVLEFPPILVGTWFIGAALAPVNQEFNSSDMLYYMEVLQPKVVISNELAEPSIREALSKHQPPVALITMDEISKYMREYVPQKEFHLGSVEDLKTHVALVLCSSGTSGKPKSVELTQFTTLILIGCNSFLPGKDNVIINQLGPYWISCQLLTMNALYQGWTQVTMQQFEVERFLSSVEKYKVTFTMLSPPFLLQIAHYPTTERYDLSSLRQVNYGGSPAAQSVIEQVEKKLRISLSLRYGMTECLGFFMAKKDVRNKPGNVGTVNVNCAAKVVDIETGKTLGPNCTGELCVRSPNVFKGYRGNPEATRDAFDEDGFLKTGDLGYYDDDGLFYIVDRIKDIFKVHGINVSPVDIEEVLLQHPSVSEAAVVGVPQNLEDARATAFIILRQGASCSEEELLKLVQDQLPKYKWLSGGVRFVEDLPRNAAGKILKYKLRNMNIKQN